VVARFARKTHLKVEGKESRTFGLFGWTARSMTDSASGFTVVAECTSRFSVSSGVGKAKAPTKVTALGTCQSPFMNTNPWKAEFSPRRMMPLPMRAKLAGWCFGLNLEAASPESWQE
jgi:hypothetical protein